MLQINCVKVPYSMTFYVQTSKAVPSQIAIGCSLLLEAISTALKTCIHQEA